MVQQNVLLLPRIQAVSRRAFDRGRSLLWYTLQFLLPKSNSEPRMYNGFPSYSAALSPPFTIDQWL